MSPKRTTSVELSLLGKLVSALLGMLDLLYYPMNWFLGRNRAKFMENGLGNMRNIARGEKAMSELAKSSPTMDKPEDMIQWTLEQKSKKTGLFVAAGSFVSPLAHLLPDESQLAHVKRVSRTPILLEGSPDREQVEASGKDEKVCLWFPASGEQGSAGRIALASELALKDGITSYIFTLPLYGARKPKTQRRFFPSTTELLCLQYIAAAAEGVVVGTYVAQKYGENSVRQHAASGGKLSICCTGFSWGASLASLCSVALAHRLHKEFPGVGVSLASYVGAPAPDSIMYGLPLMDVAWSALEKELGVSLEETKKEIGLILASVGLRSVQRVCGPHLAAVVQSSTWSDRIVTATSGIQLRDRIEAFLQPFEGKGVSTQSSHEWIAGGHVVAYARRKAKHLPLIREAHRRVL